MCTSARKYDSGSEVTLVLAVALLVCGSLSSAKAAQFIEFQIDTEKLLTLVHDRLWEEELCPQEVFQRPDHPDLDVVLDHLWFPGGLELRRFGAQIQMVVPIELHTKTMACIEDPDCGPQEYQPAAPLTINLVFDLYTEERVDDPDTEDKDEGGTCFCALLVGIFEDGKTLPIGVLGETAASTLEALASAICTKLPMDSIEALVGATATVRDSAVGANLDLTRLAVRIEFAAEGTTVGAGDPTWDDFLYGIVAPQPPAEFVTDWSIFISEELFRVANAGRFRNSLANSSEIELVSGPWAAWTAKGINGGRVTVTFTGEVDASPLCPTIDVDPVEVDIDYFVDGAVPDFVQARGTMDYDVDNDDVALCVFLTAGPVAGIIEILSLTIVVAAVLAGEQGLEQGYLPGECLKLNDEDFTCSFPADLDPIKLSKWPSGGRAVGEMTLTSMYGLPEGAVLGGPLTVQPVIPKSLLSVSNAGFNYGVTGGCSSLHLGWRGSATLRGGGHLCGPQLYVLDDPLNMFELEWAGRDLSLPNGLKVNFVFPPFAVDPAPYFANPYPLTMVIRSSAGSRAIAYTPSAPPDEGTPEWHSANNDLLVTRVNCFKFFVFEAGPFNPTWVVDPPWDIPVHVQFDDPTTPDIGITAELLDLEIAAAHAIDLEFNESGLANLTGVAVQLRGNVSVGMGGLLLRTIDDVPQSFMATIDEIVQVDFSVRQLDDQQAEFTVPQGITRIIDLPSNMLPAGMASATIELELKSTDMTLMADIERVLEEEPTDDTNLDVCGTGSCGTGAATAAFLVTLTMIGYKRRLLRGRK